MFAPNGFVSLSPVLSSETHDINSTLVPLHCLPRVLAALCAFRVIRFPAPSLPCARARGHTRPPAHSFAKFSKRHGVSRAHKSSYLALSSHLVRCQHAFARFTAPFLRRQAGSSANAEGESFPSRRERENDFERKFGIRVSFRDAR